MLICLASKSPKTDENSVIFDLSSVAADINEKAS